MAGTASGATGHVTAVQIEWNRDARDAIRPGNVRVSAQSGQWFQAGDMVDVTAVGTGSDTCSAMTTMTTGAATVDLAFSACGIMLWDVQGVAVSVSEQNRVASLKSNEGLHRGSSTSFDGPVVQHGVTAKAGHSTSRQVGVESLTTLRLFVGGATVHQLVGRQLMSILFTGDEVPTTYTGSVGTAVSNEGIWVEMDAATGSPVVMADMSRLTGGRAPSVTGATQYRMVLLQPQHLGVGQTPVNRYAFITAAGRIEG